MLIDTLKTLCALPGVSGGEDAVRDYLRELAAPHADSIRVDAIGNLIIEKKGRIPGSKKLMLAAHMDEVGLMIRAITDDGYLKFDTVGGIDRRVLIGKPVLVGPKEVPGVIGLKAYHLTSREEEKTVPKLKDFYIDIGAEDKETAEDLVYRGDLVVFDTDILEFGHGFLKAKAI
ncbi:MAG: M42 family peptidase, partial [Bacillota bacterium]|nr:M42 family peptidase [Bacillota bacterium]